MNALILPLLLVPLSVSAQTDPTLLPPVATFRPDTLKPIDIREFPYTYTTSSYRTVNGHRYSSATTHTGLKRIYSYDGIDVDKPAKTLTPTILAINDRNANRELDALQKSLRKQRTATIVGVTMTVSGFVLLTIGAVQAGDYKQALADKVKNYNAVFNSKPNGVYVSCSTFSGTIDPKTGMYLYTCLTDPRIVTTNLNLGPFLIPGSMTTPTPPTTVDVPNGHAIAIAGMTLIVAGAIIACTGCDGIDHFHRAVQFYNRALTRKISWRLEPYSGYGQSGLTLRGRF